MRKIIGRLTDSEMKRMIDAQVKLKKDANKENYHKTILAINEEACKRINKEVKECDLMGDGTIAIKHELMTDHDLLVGILLELEVIRESSTYQTNVLQAQMKTIFDQNKKEAEEQSRK